MENNKDIQQNLVQNGHMQDVVVMMENVKKSFGAQSVLKSISLKLFKGENLVILGKSGSGKSVLIKCLVGLIDYDDGKLEVFGRNVTSLKRKEMAAMREKIGFLFQSGALYDSMTVKENLEFPLQRIKRELTKAEIKEKIATVLEDVGLPETLNKMPSELSGGMRKRISLARTIILDPEIMLYDEPTTGLDPVTSDEISELINKVKIRYKTSSIIITHDINCAIKTADRMIMLKDGEVLMEGNTSDFTNSEDAIIVSFFKNNS